MHIPLFLIIASLTPATLGLHHLVITARSSLEVILPRQSTCDTICAPFQTTVDTCTTNSCLCTATVAMSLQSCINCAISNAPTVSVVASAQSLIDTFENACSGVIGVPSVTIATTPSTATTSAPGTSIHSASTTIIVPITSQITIRPSSTLTTSTASNAGNSGLPVINSAPPSKTSWHWTGAFLGLVVGNLLVF